MVLPGFIRQLAGRQRDVEASHKASLLAITLLLVAVQLPHLARLPLWVILSGSVLIGARLLAIYRPGHWSRFCLHPLFITLVAASAGFLIRLEYGYFLGRDPSVAFLYILLSAKFAEMRNRSDITILLCLAMFMLLTQFFYSQTIFSALVAVVAVLALGHTLMTVRNPQQSTSLGQNMKLVGKLLLQGAPIAALLFVVFPRLPAPLWSLPDDASATTGLSDSMDPGSIGSLSQSAEVAFRVEFHSTIPPVHQRYWRGPVMTAFDGRRWQVDSLQVPVLLQGQVEDTIDYTVMLQPHQQKWLFALDQAVSLPTSSANPSAQTQTLGRLMQDGQLLADEKVTQVLRYFQRSKLGISLSNGQYPDDNTLYLPGKNPRSIAFAQELRSNSTNEAHFAARLMQHFTRNDFHYTLQPPLLGETPVDEFMFGTRRGFCEHYASAFVVMMRAAGIPARIVTGYQGGEMNGEYMIVRQSDAHAWTEAWVDGRWRRYDPTAAVSPERVEQGLSAAFPNNSSVPRMARREGQDWIRNWQLRMDAINHAWQRWVVDYDKDTQNEFWNNIGMPKLALWQLTAAVLGAAFIWMLLLLRPQFRSNTPRSKEDKAWGQLLAWLEHQGIKRSTNETPDELLTRASVQLPEKSRELKQASTLFDDLRFRPLDARARQQRLTLWRSLRRRLG